MKHFEFITASAPDLITALDILKNGIAENFHVNKDTSGRDGPDFFSGLVLHQVLIYPEVRLTEGLKTPTLVCHVVGVLRNDSVDLVYQRPAFVEGWRLSSEPGIE